MALSKNPSTGKSVLLIKESVNPDEVRNSTTNGVGLGDFDGAHFGASEGFEQWGGLRLQSQSFLANW